MTFEIIKCPVGDNESYLLYNNLQEFPKANRCELRTFKEENKEFYESQSFMVVSERHDC